jgi:hypothetical protein
MLADSASLDEAPGGPVGNRGRKRLDMSDRSVRLFP